MNNQKEKKTVPASAIFTQFCMVSEDGTDDFGTDVPPKFQIAFGNDVQGISLDGQAFDIAGASYKFNWSPTSKAYAAGKVYKIANQTFKETTAAQAMPR